MSLADETSRRLGLTPNTAISLKGYDLSTPAPAPAPAPDARAIVEDAVRSLQSVPVPAPVPASRDLVLGDILGIDLTAAQVIVQAGFQFTLTPAEYRTVLRVAARAVTRSLAEKAKGLVASYPALAPVLKGENAAAREAEAAARTSDTAPPLPTPAKRGRRPA